MSGPTVVLLIPPCGQSWNERDRAVGSEFARCARRFLAELAGASAMAALPSTVEMLSALVAGPSSPLVALPFTLTAAIPDALRASPDLIARSLEPLSRDPPCVTKSLLKIARNFAKAQSKSSHRAAPTSCSVIVLSAAIDAIVVDTKLSAALDALKEQKISLSWSQLYVDVESPIVAGHMAPFDLHVSKIRRLRQLISCSNRATFEMRKLAEAEMAQFAHAAVRHSRELNVQASLVWPRDATAPLSLDVIPLQLGSEASLARALGIVESAAAAAAAETPLVLRIEAHQLTALKSVDLTLVRGEPHAVRAHFDANFSATVAKMQAMHAELAAEDQALVVHVSAAGRGGSSDVCPHALLLARVGRPHELALLFLACRDTFLDLPPLASDASSSVSVGSSSSSSSNNNVLGSLLPCADFTPLRHSSGARTVALRQRAAAHAAAESRRGRR
tara:strand:- start:937 stop:2277 length:1341 start_codon:yes stop_codon:yes gene_type:complete